MDVAVFSVSDIFGGAEDSDQDEAPTTLKEQESCTREHSFPGMSIKVKEFDFHPVNANLLWPGATFFAEWLVAHKEKVQGRKILELGSGTGALAIFLHLSLAADVTTSDYDDDEIEKNIAHNCALNGMKDPLPHIPHTWGDSFPLSHEPVWDLILASDILLYVKQYENLVRTLNFLLSSHTSKGDGTFAGRMEVAQGCGSSNVVTVASGDGTNQVLNASTTVHCEGGQVGSCNLPQGLEQGIRTTYTTAGGKEEDSASSPRQVETGTCGTSKSQQTAILAIPPVLPSPCFLMSWRRRIPKSDECIFFDLCRMAGMTILDFGGRVFCIHK